MPLQKMGDGRQSSTQWDMGDVEKAGLLKMDFLGLRNLTMLDHGREVRASSYGAGSTSTKIPLDDPETYELLPRGETKGVFQLESGGIRDLLRQMKPTASPTSSPPSRSTGPARSSAWSTTSTASTARKQCSYLHPVLKQILEETYGVMVYQEQVMRILNRLGGLRLGAGRLLRRAIAKKKPEDIAEVRAASSWRADGAGLQPEEADEIFDLIEPFGGYGFNKSHTTAVRPGRLPDRLPEGPPPGGFMAALMNSVMGRRRSWRSTWRSAAGWAFRCCRRT